ncbi:MAG: L-aspartate oxidase [Acidobacteria bacterium]|nr:L-aspartate oxidase [Acidobacteriota bacterium]
MQTNQSDVLVIGGGIAGLMFALKVADQRKVNLLLKDSFEECSTQYAQGGINAVLSEGDSFDAHIEDTINCGYGLCHKEVVQTVVHGGPKAISELVELGVSFTRTEHGGYELHREGGHQHRRVVHAKDATGAEIMRALREKASTHPNITVWFDYIAIDLILVYEAGSKTLTSKTQVVGAYVLDAKSNRVHAFTAQMTYLATGGIGKIYPYTSNPRTATGDGIVMAYRAGLDVVNMEFIQFHPTLLHHHSERKFLISEALRGQGGILRNQAGEPFMANYHPELRDLAPRDVVARAIDSELKRTGSECVFLDMTQLPADEVVDHFPTIYKKLLTLGIDITKQQIPVVPAAHYSCGGVRVDLDGKTSCLGLMAGGECTFTGLHGSNRLASNSLLEAAVYAHRSADYVLNHSSHNASPPQAVADWVYHNYSDEHEESLLDPLWNEMKWFMWNYVGIVRSDKRLQRAVRRIQSLRTEIEESYWNFSISKDLIELRNISIIAELVIRSAVVRKESRGLNYNVDHPAPNPTMAKDTCISKARQGLFR